MESLKLNNKLRTEVSDFKSDYNKLRKENDDMRTWNDFLKVCVESVNSLDEEDRTSENLIFMIKSAIEDKKHR